MTASTPVRRAGALVAGQGLGLALLGLGYGAAGLLGSPRHRGLEELGAVLAVGCGVQVLLLGRGLWRARSWARSPVLVTEVILVPVALGLLQGGLYAVGVPLLAWAGAVLGLLATPAAREELREG